MLEKIIIVSFCVIAIWATLLYGMIFGFIGTWAQKLKKNGKPNIPAWLQKPLFDCVICMTMYYGSALYWIYWGESVKEWVIVVIAAMGITTWFAKTKIR